MFRTLSDTVSVSPQITAEDVAAAKELGFTQIVCNRPAGEEPSAPQPAEIEDAAEAHGLSFLSLPFAAGGPSAAQVQAMGAAVETAEKTGGKVLAYCRSGTRSATLWAMAQGRAGADEDAVIEAARAAGYDLSGLRGRLSGP